MVMDEPDTMYSNSKQMIRDNLHQRLDRAVSVAEQAVDRFLPPDEQQAVPVSMPPPSAFPVAPVRRRSPPGAAHAPTLPRRRHPSQPHNEGAMVSSRISGGKPLQRLGAIPRTVQNRLANRAQNTFNDILNSGDANLKGMKYCIEMINVGPQTTALTSTLSHLYL